MWGLNERRQRKLRCGEQVYRVYLSHGEVVVRKGRIHPCNSWSFIPDDKPNTYLTQNPSRPMKIEHGKVYCIDKKDIPEAIEMVKRHHERYLEDMQRRLEKASSDDPQYRRTKSDSPLICPKCSHQFNMGGNRRKLNWTDGIMMDGHKFRKSECFHCGCEFYFCNASADYARECGLKCVYEKNEFERMVEEMRKENKKMPTLTEAIRIMQDGSKMNKYMTSEYSHAYGMAVGALCILERIGIMGNSTTDTAKDAWETLSDGQKDLCYKLMRGEISADEYIKQSLALEKKEERENEPGFEFKCTEAEFKAIKHALEHLYLANKRALSPISSSPYYKNYSVDQLHRMKVENAVIGDLVDAISEVE